MENGYKEIIEKYSKQGIELYVDGEKLKYKSINGQLDEDILMELKLNKEGLKEYIKKLENKYDVKDDYAPFPLSPVQTSYLYGRDDLHSYGNVSCHIYQEFLYDNLDVSKVQDTWNYLINKHEMLRAVIFKEGYQKILQKVPEYEVVTGDRISIREQLEDKVYQLEKWPMFDIGVSNYGEKSILHFSMDFMICDWSSIWQLLLEFEMKYFKGIENDRQSKISFRNYIISEEKTKENSEYKKAKAYWSQKTKKLKTSPVIPLKTLKETDVCKFKRLSLTLDKDMWDKFKILAQNHALTPTASVLTVYSEVLKKWSTEKEFLINLTLFNKKNLGENIEYLVGDFTNTSVISIKNIKESFSELAREVNKELFSSIDNSAYPGVNILRDIAKLHNSKEFLAPYVFTSAIGLIKKRLIGRYVYGISQTPQVFIDCQAMDTELGLQINWDVREGIFEDDMLEDMFSEFKKILINLSNNKEFWEKRLEIDLPKWQREIREKVNATNKKINNKTLLEDFIEKVKSYPDKAAVIDSRGSISYKELYNKSVSIALALKEKNVKKGEHIIVKLPHNKSQVYTILGILMVGAIYVPVDFNIEEKRLENILKQCNCKVILTNGSCYDSRQRNFANIDDVNYRLDLINMFNIEHVDSNDAAYIMFTSETTENPKGAVINHGAVFNTIYDINQKFEISERDCLLRISKLDFDLSIYDIFGMLSVGGTIVYPDESEYLNPAHWDKLIEENSVSILNMVPELMKLYLNYLENLSKKQNFIKLILLSRDWIPLNMPNAVQKTFVESKIIVLGGATEASIWSNYHEYKGIKKGWKSIPYGKPLTNQQIYVLDKNFEDCPVYCEGNLYIAGRGLAEGYLGDKKLTEEKFFIHPLKQVRLYSTGDLGRYLSSGEIEFLGTEDTQVKIRGNRIDLEEIKNALIKQKVISNAIVMVNENKKEFPIESVVTIAREDRDDKLDSHYETLFNNNEGIDIKNKEYLFSNKYRELCDIRDKICLNAILNAMIDTDILKKEPNSDLYKRKRKLNDNKYNWIIDRWLYQLIEKNIIYAENGDYKIQSILTYDDIANLWTKVFLKWDVKNDNSLKYLKYVKDSTDNLVEILNGKIDPVNILYPEGSDIYTDAMYNTSINSIVINNFYCNFINEYIKNNNHRKIRILEIGAGTGATSEKIIDLLNGVDYEYHFTDGKKYFLSKAKKKFEDNKNVKIYQLDINEDPIKIGIEYNYFDIIIGAYVLENAKDVVSSLNYIRNICAPKGYLLFSEPIRNEPWIIASQVFMMEKPLDSLRKNKFFLSIEEWKNILYENNEKIFTLPREESVIEKLGMVLFIKQFKSDYSFINREKIYNNLKICLPIDLMPDKITFLEKFKLTSNGIVDIKKNFSYETDYLRCAENESINFDSKKTSIPKEALNICAKFLDEEELNLNKNLYECGADSLILAQIAAEITKSIESSSTFESILRELIDEPTFYRISELLKGGNGTEHNISNDEFIYSKKYSAAIEDKRLRVILHGAFGNLENLKNLAMELCSQNKGDILLMGVSDIGKYLDINSDELVEKLANEYYKEIQKFSPTNVQIIGYSFSGVVAIEVSRRLLEAGILVDNLAVIEGGSLLNYNYDELLLEFNFLQAFNIEISDIGFKETNILDIAFSNMDNNYENAMTVNNILSKMRFEEDILYVKKLNSLSQQKRFELYYNLVKNKGNSITKKSFLDMYKIFIKSFNAQKFMPEIYFGDIDYYIAKDNVGAYKHFNILAENWKNIIIGDIRKFYIPGNHYSSVQGKSNSKVLANMLNENMSSEI